MLETKSWITQKDIPIVVTPRGYTEVSNALGVAENFFPHDAKVLSIGEGLSDFVTTLHQRKRIDAYALDPIYGIGGNILREDDATIPELFSNHFGSNVIYNPHFRTDKLPRQAMLAERMIAGSVYALPFADDSFSHIVGHRVIEHIDLGRALPEMTRVLQPHGEIRLGDPMIQFNAVQRKFYLGSWQYDSWTMESYFNGDQSMRNACDWLSSEGSLSMYIIAGEAPVRTEIKIKGISMVGSMIVRNDEEKPHGENIYKVMFDKHNDLSILDLVPVTA